MRRVPVLLAVAAVLAGAAAGASTAGGSSAKADQIALRLRYKNGPWLTRISLRLQKTRLMRFEVCGVLNSSAKFTCAEPDGQGLPERTVLRLDEKPFFSSTIRGISKVTKAWGQIGGSGSPVIQAVLSNTVTGNDYRTIALRATLRNVSGETLVTSNIVRLVWHR